MTYESIPGAPTVSSLDLAAFTETDIPIGSKIRCIVTAAGPIDDPVWGWPTDSSIEHTTNAIEITSATTPTTPRFVTDTLSVSLNPDGTGSASIQTAGDLSDTRVEWEIVIS